MSGSMADRPRSGARPWLLRPPYLPLLAGGLVSLVFAAALAWYFSRPIRYLQRAFEQAAAGGLEVRVGPLLSGRRDDGQGVYGDRLEAINAMARQRIFAEGRVEDDPVPEDALFIGLAGPPCSAHGDIDDVVVRSAAFPAIVVVVEEAVAPT